MMLKRVFVDAHAVATALILAFLLVLVDCESGEVLDTLTEEDDMTTGAAKVDADVKATIGDRPCESYITGTGSEFAKQSLIASGVTLHEKLGKQ